MYALYIVVCPFVLLRLAIALSVNYVLAIQICTDNPAPQNLFMSLDFISENSQLIEDNKQPVTFYLSKYRLLRNTKEVASITGLRSF
jgi:hypothetical protein